MIFFLVTKMAFPIWNAVPFSDLTNSIELCRIYLFIWLLLLLMTNILDSSTFDVQINKAQITFTSAAFRFHFMRCIFYFNVNGMQRNDFEKFQQSLLCFGFVRIAWHEKRNGRTDKREMNERQRNNRKMETTQSMSCVLDLYEWFFCDSHWICSAA